MPVEESAGAAGDRTPAAIVEVAARLLHDGGPGAVTTRAVAAAAGVQPPTIYRLFGDKDGLLDAVAEHVFATYVDGKARNDDTADPDSRSRPRLGDAYRLRVGEPGAVRASRRSPTRHPLPGRGRWPGHPAGSGAPSCVGRPAQGHRTARRRHDSRSGHRGRADADWPSRRRTATSAWRGRSMRPSSRRSSRKLRRCPAESPRPPWRCGQAFPKLPCSAKPSAHCWSTGWIASPTTEPLADVGTWMRRVSDGKLSPDGDADCRAGA